MVENKWKKPSITEIDHEQEKMEIIEKERAEQLIKDPKFFEIIMKELDKKLVGEYLTRIAIFLSMCSIWVRNLQSQLNTLVNSESSAGKSWISKKIYDIFPEGLKQYRTKISAEAFTYWHNKKFEPDFSWDGMLLYLEDARESVINSPTFKLMCSEGSTATVVRNQRAIDVEIEGTPVILLTSAESEPIGEVLNRLNSISLDETEDQTQKILEEQSREAKDGYKEEYDMAVRIALHYLERVDVKIPFADKIFKHFPKKALRVRRDYPRFLDLIKSSTALHQHQREKDEHNYFIATKEDYELARSCLSTIQFKGLFGLTHKLKKAYSYCNALSKSSETLIPNWFNAKEIYTSAPFVTAKVWYGYLNDLLKLGVLSIESKKIESSDKPVAFYTSATTQLINLPKFEELGKEKKDE